MSLVSKEELNQKFSAIRDEAKRRGKAFKETSTPKIRIGMATCGTASGAVETQKAFEEVLVERDIEARIHTVGCVGHCYAEPVVVIERPGFPPILYHQVTPGKARMLVKSFLEDGDPLFEHILGATEENELIPSVMDFPRFNQEQRLVMEKCGRIDPEDIYEYIAEGGYSSLVKALQLSPDEVIREVENSGLRGRGGAGFPTGKKWQLGRRAKGDQKIIICNGDEGDPGAYMDRTILESNPHQILEGMAICAYAVGAQEGIVYVRAEYPLAVKMVLEAVVQAKELGFLGRGHSGQPFPFGDSSFPRIGGLCLWRRNGAYPIYRRETGHASVSPSLSGAPRPLGPAHCGKQCEDLRLHTSDYQSWCCLV